MTTENTKLNFSGDEKRVKLQQYMFDVQDRGTVLSKMNKLSSNTGNSIFGTTRITQAPEQCKVLFFDEDFNFVYSLISNEDGTFSTNRLSNMNKYHVVCVALDDAECPKITNLIQPIGT